MTIDLNEIVVFAKVVSSGSFVGASRDLQLPTSTVSRRISTLEERLGATLLHRTTRKLSLTDAGRVFMQHAERVVAEVEAAALAVSQLQEVPRGRLRATVPLNFGHLRSIVAAFLRRYPDVQLELACSDRVVDLIEEGFDLALRVGRLPDSSLVARPVGTITHYVVATPEYLEAHGSPEDPEALPRFDCILFGAGEHRRTWTLRDEARTVTVRVRGRLTVNDFDFLDEAVLEGLGIALVPAFRCAEQLRLGRLQRVLPSWSTPEMPLHVVYPAGPYLSPNVRVFVEHLREHLPAPTPAR